MKQLIISILMFVVSLSANSQTSICGVKFGTSYDKAKQILNSRFGKEHMEATNDLQIVFTNKYYEGYTWNLIQTLFVRDQFDRYFNSCIFIQFFETFNTAKNFVEELKTKMQEKNGILHESLSPEGYTMYSGGVDPFDSNKYGFHITIIKYDENLFGAGILYGKYNVLQ